MENDIDHYLTTLLNAFRQHRKKFVIGPGPLQQSRNESLRLKNDRGFFEVKFLRILSRNDTDVSDFEQLPRQKSQEILGKLHDLFVLLEQLVNTNFKPIVHSLAPCQTIYPPGGLYPKLEKLLSFLDKSDGPFDIASGTSLSIFTIDKPYDGVVARSVVHQLIDILDDNQPAPQKKNPATTASMKSSVAADRWILSLECKYREFVGTIFDTIHTEFERCESSDCKSPHQVMMQLLDVALSDSEEGLGMFVRCPRPTTSGWQNTRCMLKENPRAESVPSEKLCDSVAYSFRREQGLALLLDKISSTISQSSSFDLPNTDPNRYPPRNLKGLIEDRVFSPLQESGQRNLFNYPERRALAAKLALNLLIFCAWRHTARSWDCKDVYFLNSQAGYNRCSPYISCLINHDSTSAFKAADDEGAPIQCFTEFAKLLLEIEYGPLPDGDFSASNDYGWKIIRDFHNDRVKWQDWSRTEYLEAVDICLRFDSKLRDARNTRHGKLEIIQETCRNLIRTKIVRNIVADLPSFKKPPLKRSRHALDDDVDDDDASHSHLPIVKQSLPKKRVRRAHLDLDDQRLQHVTEKNLPLSMAAEEPGSSTYGQGKSGATTLMPQPSYSLPSRAARHLDNGGYMTTLSSRYPSESRGANNAVCSQEVSNKNTGSLLSSQSSHQSSRIANSALEWFKKLDTCVQKRIGELRRINDRAVKVAVIDTGIDKDHPRIQQHLKCNNSEIRGCKNWVTSSDDVSDDTGHGTAVCDVLLRISRVHLFVGKVSSSAKFDEATPARVAKAINHAASINGWNIDIIVLSLGFEREDPAIRKAVLDAFYNDKIILAAASNSGSAILDPIVHFPARVHGQVLSIRSATGYGRRSHASPAPTSNDDNFMVIGEELEVAWPAALNGGSTTRYVSGCSFATPVAAGIAALVLEYSIQKFGKKFNVHEESVRNVLWTYRGIRKIFLHMSTSNGELPNDPSKMICPWKLFHPDLRREGYELEIERLMKSV
ncbi:hypothetical protein FQN49_007809 [Arthroderma sp. PD_2]|nr:hypothetical protein FQN49_007809 [Arthroderma sp. PD_2]